MCDLQGQTLTKIEQDTDRDRYMSPLEAKEYGIIDHIIGGEEAVFKIKGSINKFPKVRSSQALMSCSKLCVHWHGRVKARYTQTAIRL